MDSKVPSDFENEGEKIEPSLPPEASEQPAEEPDSVREALERKAKTSRSIAWLLDECIRIPGTKVRIGLDPILGLVPGGGETVSSVVGAFLLADASRRGIPYRTLFKMGGNLLLNAAIGALPGIGDLFSIWFKSNSRNFELMRVYVESPEGKQAKGGWGPLLLVIAFITVLLTMVVTVNILMWWFFLDLLEGWMSHRS